MVRGRVKCSDKKQSRSAVSFGFHRRIRSHFRLLLWPHANADNASRTEASCVEESCYRSNVIVRGNLVISSELDRVRCSFHGPRLRSKIEKHTRGIDSTPHLDPPKKHQSRRRAEIKSDANVRCDGLGTRDRDRDHRSVGPPVHPWRSREIQSRVRKWFPALVARSDWCARAPQ